MSYRLTCNKIIKFFFFIQLIIGNASLYAAQRDSKFSTGEQNKISPQQLKKIIIFCGITCILHEILRKHQDLIIGYEKHLKYLGMSSFLITTYLISEIDTFQNINQWLYTNLFADTMEYQIWLMTIMIINIGISISTFSVPIEIESIIIACAAKFIPMIMENSFRIYNFTRLMQESSQNIDNSKKIDLCKSNNDELKFLCPQLYKISQLSYQRIVNNRVFPPRSFYSALLYGLPGCGKSALVKKFLVNDNPKIVTELINITSNFFEPTNWLNFMLCLPKKFNKDKRLIIYYDELIVAIGNEKYFSQLYELLFANSERCESILLIAATNDKEKFPNSSLIGNRFNEKIHIDLPNKEKIMMIINKSNDFALLFKKITADEQNKWIEAFMKEKGTLRELVYIMNNVLLSHEYSKDSVITILNEELQKKAETVLIAEQNKKDDIENGSIRPNQNLLVFGQVQQKNL